MFFCFISIVSITHFINKSESSRGLTIFKISSISSFEIFKVVNPDPNIFLWIAASVADVAAVIPNGIKTLLANGSSTFPLKVIKSSLIKFP